MNNKMWIIARREYLTRVQKKSFILVTLLTPLGIALFSVLIGFIMNAGSKADQRVLIHDDTGIIQQMAANAKDFPYEFSGKDLSVLKTEYRQMGYDILVYVPALKDSASTHVDASYFSEEKPSLMLLESIESKLGDQIESYRMHKSNIDQSLLDSFGADINRKRCNGSQYSGSTATANSIL
jgi:ABC-2 type transport system permease protein